MSEIHRFDSSITCHAWNKERTLLALGSTSYEGHIYQQRSSGWELVNILSQHRAPITDMDWAPKTNMIVTCATDKSAFVWTRKGQEWKPIQVHLRISKGGTCVKWSPKENKFAVGSGDKLVSVCYYEKEHTWWISKHIRHSIRSTVTTLDWHPNNNLLVVGSTDFKVRVYFASFNEVRDPRPTKWGGASVMGQLLAEFSNSPNGGGWIHSVAFSPDGNRLSWVSRDSSICLVDVSRGKIVHKLKTPHLPFLNCIWVSHDSIVTSGHDCCPMLYTLDEAGQLKFNCKLDVGQKRKVARGSALRKFGNLGKMGSMDNLDLELNTIHQKAITCLSIHSGQVGSVNKISTTSLDGQLVIWDLKELT